MTKINITNMQKEIEYLEKNDGMKGLAYDGISTSPTNERKSSTENIALSNMEAITYLERMITKSTLEIEAIDRALEGLEEREKIILIEKYVKANPWYKITPLVFTEERQCRNIRKKAIHKMITGMYGSK